MRRINRITVLFIFFLCSTIYADQVTYKFPPNFLWSTATSAFQIEGATREDGRGISIWDTHQYINGSIAGGATADIASDSYHKYKEDVKIMKELGVKTYRMSFSWSRIFPTGRGKTNPKGIQYYHNVLDELINNGIVPLVTLYHWDLPQALQDIGGWLHPDSSNWMAEYARFCFQEYGSKVPYWITVNEPRTQTAYGYGHSHNTDAPDLRTDGDWAEYLSGHNMVLAHGKANQIYQKEFKTKCGGQIGIANCLVWMEPMTNNTEDIDARDTARDTYFGQYTDPMVFGDYSDRMKQFVWNRSMATGRLTSVLPEFTQDEKNMLKGSLDFIGLNYYYTILVRKLQPNDTDNGVMPMQWGIYGQYSDDWTPIGPAPQWIYNTPFGLHKSLLYLKERYNMPIMVTENGCMDTISEGLNDVTRINYLQGHIAAVGQAIAEGVNVTGYALWSLIDNFEWGAGYVNRFGLHNIDFSNPDRPRTQKQSAKWYKGIISDNAITIDNSRSTTVLPTTVTTTTTPGKNGGASLATSFISTIFLLFVNNLQ